MKIEISMTEDFAYFSIFTKSYNRYISISRHEPYIKTIDHKHCYKTKKNYSKISYLNKWEEIKPLTEKEIKQVKWLISKTKTKVGLNK